ncbi:hypothetical protein RND81_13G149400 [Saponaria officinalis]|uniref:Uncharacterized protein n=1 Tax=Saponaria officinalis TaxID=3572 RepID=A0AAW1H5R1_SAPOF
MRYFEFAFYTDDEAERAFEEFYEDVHTEFLKFGELVNFKVCRNASSHLRGNVYVHYKFLESAMLAYQSINGRYFAGKQLSCEFVNLTKWKAAICGEYMKSRLKTCSRGSVCNFIHCFQNPGGDYEWADWDKPAPRYWQNEMGALFGYKDDRSKDENLRYSSRRSRSRGPGSPRRKTHSDEDNDHRRRYQQKHRGDYEENRSSPRIHRTKRKRTDSVDGSDCSSEEQISRHNSKSKREKHLKLERHVKMNREHQAIGSDDESRKRESGDRSLKRKSRTSSWQKHDNESVHEHHSCEKSPHMEKHLIYRKHEKEDSLQKTKEAFSSDIDFARDGSVRDKNRRHRRESLRVKVEAYLSDNDSYDGRFVGHVSPQKNMRNVDVSNDKSEYRESNSKNDSLESAEDKYHNHSNSSRAVKNNSNSALDGDRIEVDGKRRHRSRRKSRRSENRGDFTDSESERLNYHNHSNSSRAVKNNSNSALDGDRIEVDGKRRHRSRRKSRRSENRGDFTDSESERLKERSNDRHRRSTKNRKQVRHEAESSDSGSDRGMPRRYEEKPKVDRRIRSRSKSDLRSVNGEEKDDGCGERSNMPHMEHDSGFKSPGDCERPEVKEKADEAAVGNFRVEETTTSERGEICYRNSSSQSIDGEAAFDLEQTYRIAALKKLEEMRKCKDTLLVQSRKLNMSVEIHSNENTTVEGAEGIDGGEEISASRETGTRVASERRKRI